MEICDSYIYYQNLFDKENGPFFFKDNLRITELWDEVYDILSSQTVENLSDYISILHKITSIEV
jgi:predicted house-cleaning noncanonical NTP pyrophosphatase (MazG superfamily)